MKPKNTLAFVAALLLGVSGCETVKTTSAGAVGVDRKQQMLVSSEAIDQGAAQAYEAELKAARDKGVLNTDKAQLARVTNVAKRIVSATPAFRADARGWNWQFNVQKTKELNAYCMPGGRIMVYSGLIESLDLSDAELATVLAHEVAHALREHTRERVSRAYAQQLVLAGAAAVTGASEGAANIANMVAAGDVPAAVRPRPGIRGGPDRARAHGARRLRPARRADAVEQDERAPKPRARRNS